MKSIVESFHVYVHIVESFHILCFKWRITSASALHEATAYSCQFWILLGSKRMWLGHKFVPNNVLHLFLSSRRHDRNPDVKSLNNIKPIQIIFIIIIYMFTIFCDRLKPSKNYLDIFISVEYCLPYWRQMNSIHN